MIKPINQTPKPFSTFMLPTPQKSVTTSFIKNTEDTLSTTRAEFPWATNPIIISALDELKKVTFDKKDTEYIKNLGLELPFDSGKQAVEFIKNSHLRIAFEDTGSANIHAQYDFIDNKILLNKRYQNTSDTADVLALAEAILHESCHAKDNDSASSIQEELNNLGMGALAHRFFEKKYPSIFNKANTLIVNDGVNVYAKIFFDNDPNKKALKERIREKYGLLPVGDNIHKPSALAFEIKNSFPFI